jgi:nicotinate-nucleotide pyrophosphorylase (carboxylating)
MPLTHFSPATRALIDLALQEDLHAGDVTSDAVFDADAPGRATFRARHELVLAGCAVADAVFTAVDPRIEVAWGARDGQLVGAGAVGVAHGPIRSLLRAERTALNFVRHLSGVATATYAFVRELEGSGTRLLDTRKTTPGFRELEKFAVRMGGGHNHRFHLGAGAMIKNNHIDAAGSIAEAVRRVRARLPFLSMVEVEVRDEAEARAAVDAGADALLLDNMDTATMRRICSALRGRAKLEASGNITVERLRELRDVGLDCISTGWVTHSAPAADLSLTVGGSWQTAPILATLATP